MANPLLHFSPRALFFGSVLRFQRPMKSICDGSTEPLAMIEGMRETNKLKMTLYLFRKFPPFGESTGNMFFTVGRVGVAPSIGETHLFIDDTLAKPCKVGPDRQFITGLTMVYIGMFMVYQYIYR